MEHPELFADAATHIHCQDTICTVMAEHGCEVDITIRPPESWTSYHRQVTCGHGITYYTYPTKKQFDLWIKQGLDP